MPVGLNSERARQRERAVQVRIVGGIERAAAIRFGREFNRLGRELAAMYRELGGAMPLLEPALEESARRMTVILDRLYTEVGNAMAGRVRSAAGKAFAGQLQVKAEDATTLFQLAMRQFIEGQSGDRIDEITATTLGQLRGALATIDEEGLGEIPAAKIIENATGGAIGRARAARIARTEGHTGSQFASQTQIDQLGVKYFKRWVSVQDQRTRDRDDAFNHRKANGQRREREQKYDILKKSGGTEKLDYPGDPKGSPGNIINCRCVQVYDVVR